MFEDGTLNLALSAVVGAIISLVIVFNSSNTKPNTNNKKDDSLSEDIDYSENHLEIHETVAVIDKDRFAEKSQKLQALLGVSPDQIQKAVEETNNSIRTGKREIHHDVQSHDEANWFSVVDSVVLIVILCSMLYFINMASHGDFGRILLGLFPKEFESLKLTKFIEGLHVIKKVVPVEVSR